MMSPEEIKAAHEKLAKTPQPNLLRVVRDELGRPCVLIQSELVAEFFKLKGGSDAR